jgi:3-hydroxybutyrate dehydrogenase
MFEINDHVAVVTGSTSGIGLALARSLAEGGARVVLNGLGDPTEIERVRAELEASAGVAVRYHGADMTEPAEIQDLIDFAVREFGRLDILVNNAGVQHVAPIDEFPLEKWDQIVAINLSAVFHAIRAAVPVMKAQGRGPHRQHRIGAWSGGLGLQGTLRRDQARRRRPDQVGRGGAGADGRDLRRHLPGYVKTPLVEGQIVDQAKARGMSEDKVLTDVILAAQPTKKFVEYEHLAGLLRYLVSDAGASATGAALSVDGGWTAQ